VSDRVDTVEVLSILSRLSVTVPSGCVQRLSVTSPDAWIPSRIFDASSWADVSFSPGPMGGSNTSDTVTSPVG
jgi:hypothetical protein